MITIPWSDGTGQYIYIDFSPIINNSPAIITSDTNNTGYTRRKTIQISSLSNLPNSSIFITIEQYPDDTTIMTYDKNASIYENNKSTY